MEWFDNYNSTENESQNTEVQKELENIIDDENDLKLLSWIVETPDQLALYSWIVTDDKQLALMNKIASDPDTLAAFDWIITEKKLTKEEKIIVANYISKNKINEQNELEEFYENELEFDKALDQAYSPRVETDKYGNKL